MSAGRAAARCLAAAHAVTLAATLLAALLPGGAHAQSEPAPEVGPELHLRWRSALWSGDRQLGERGRSLASHLWLDAYQVLGPQAALKLEAWASAESSGLRPGPQLRAREALLRIGPPELQWRLGWQIFAWGRADRMNPTDNLSARDYRRLLSQDEEQRFGSPALALQWEAAEGWQLQAVFKRFEASVLPTARAEQGLAWRGAGTGKTGAHGGRPEFGLRLDRSGAGLDSSLSWFSGRDKQRSLLLAPPASPSASPTALQREHAPLHSLGLDLALVQGAWNLRGEAAWLRYHSEAPAALGAKQAQLFVVLGAERSLAGSASVNLQWYGRRLGRAQPAADPSGWLALVRRANGQDRRSRQGLSLRYAQRLFNDSLDYELLALFGLEQGDRALRPRLNWQLQDGLRLSLGADLFRGPADSPWGALRRNSAAFVELSGAL